jgi:hypothetical protein
MPPGFAFVRRLIRTTSTVQSAAMKDAPLRRVARVKRRYRIAT